MQGVLTSRDLEIIRQECMKVKQAKIQKKQEKQRQEAEEDQLGNLVDDGAVSALHPSPPPAPGAYTLPPPFTH